MVSGLIHHRRELPCPLSTCSTYSTYGVDRLEGVMLLASYAIIATAFFLYQ